MVCVNCGTTYTPKRKTSRFCSTACYVKYRLVDVACDSCGILFTKVKSKVRTKNFCCNNCRGEWGKSKIGPLNNNWKGGISTEHTRLRNSEELSEWRLAVFTRDNFTCQVCGAKGKLNAHHIKRFRDYPTLRTDINNGITLCVTCHNKESALERKIDAVGAIYE